MSLYHCGNLYIRVVQKFVLQSGGNHFILNLCFNVEFLHQCR